MYILMLVPVLLVIFYQDLKSRAVSLMVFVSLLAAIMLVRFLVDAPFIAVGFLINLAYLTLLMIILLAYFRIRFRSWAILKQGLGIGDVVFWLIITLLLSPQVFLFWFNASLILSLISHYVLRRFSWYGEATKIPLAGLQAVFLIPFLF